MSMRDPKIVQIETRYVQTDAVNFKDVVQSLTGKNSSTDWIMEGRFANAAAAAARGDEARGSTIAVKTEEILEASKSNYAVNETSLVSLPASMLMMNINNMSFNELDRLLLELPPIKMHGGD